MLKLEASHSTKLEPFYGHICVFDMATYPYFYICTNTPIHNHIDLPQGSYTHIPHDHLAYRYEVLKVIGKGSFGQVVKAYDHKEHHHVAVKMVRNEKRFHRQVQTASQPGCGIFPQNVPLPA